MPIFLEGALDVTLTDATVEFTFTVTNGGTEPVDLEFQNGKIADIIVTENNNEIWRWSDSRMFTRALQHKTLAPGESAVHEARWEDPSSGEHVAEAHLKAADVSLVEQAEFEV